MHKLPYVCVCIYDGFGSIASMWYPSDYSRLLELHIEASENYRDGNPNSKLAKSFFTSAHTLHDLHDELVLTAGDLIGNRHRMQLIYLRRGVDALFSLFWLIRHHQYTASYGRIRFLLETYLVVREFNRNKEQSGKKYKEKLDEYKNGEYTTSEADPLTQYFDGRRRDLLGKFEEKYDWFDDMMGLLSDMGAHPQSIQTMDHDKTWNRGIENDLIQFGNIFNFAFAAQYVRVFEDTDAALTVREKLDPIFVQLKLVQNEIPVFLEEDLEFGEIVN